jgi:REP element-mobilizing transposase RayT
VHVVLRVVAAVHSLRRRRCYHAIRWAVVSAAVREDFRIVHLSIQRTHLHLLVEADDKHALARGMQGFQISAAKLLNRAISAERIARGEPRRRGAVFPDRYHATILRSPTQTRHALAYVLLNWRKHGEALPASPAPPRGLDWFSSGISFPDWREYGDAPTLWRGPPSYEPLLVFRPRTWLLREGWQRGGPLISLAEAPGPRG